MHLIASGFASVLLEVIFKLNVVDENDRMEAFLFYRDLLQYEYQNADRQLRKSDDQLESYRLIKLLPNQLYELFLDDGDETAIFSNFSREWSTPNLIWTQMMMKEMLLIYIEYNNQILKKLSNDYGQIFPINSPLFPEQRNETFVENMMLKEYNLQPNWQIDEGIIVFMNELVESINQSLRLYLDGNFNNSESSIRQFERLSCKLITQFTTLELALEQFFYNSLHPEFENQMKLLEDYDQSQIDKLLQEQRDTIPIQIVKSVQKWLELIIADHITINPLIKSCLIQIHNIISQSEIALVILDEFDVVKKSLIICLKVMNSQQHKYDKLLTLVTICDMITVKFLISKLDSQHFNLILQLYQTVIKEDQMIINAFKNLIALIYTDNSVSGDFNKFLLQESVTIQSSDLKILQNKDFNKLNLWRKQFDENYKIPIYEQISKSTKEYPVFPIISECAIQQLPYMSEILENRLKMITKYYDEYLTNLQSEKIIEINMNLNSQYEPQTEQISLRQSTIVKEQSDLVLIGEDEIFS
ncbi:unnamed protein product (macronuclear) [Paramecium tetraurelia]|uniref:Uncharacterized protein n=1 Tax=Paramecium tetraurelia TaxID=5888 RepID=A0D152_PARTE|nr:uncharacterized protein GSPATT00012293001 [Paramecium tetraurelia]CAK76769.1 unnamed protein product [Paramecium tetraurelia]|eukprot:XP_001444166.1 hypothetical protein (macronuclear) [Paramecium tetraurelia strain d4-2]